MAVQMDTATSKMDTDLSPVTYLDGDELMLLLPSSTPPPTVSLVPSSTDTLSVPVNSASPSDVVTVPTIDENEGKDGNEAAVVFAALDRRSKRKRLVQRLQAKNKTLKLSLAQAKADLAAERQQRAVVDQIYLKIKTDLNQKLENEEFRNLNLKAELDQVNQDLKELKGRTSISSSSSYGLGSYFPSSFSSSGSRSLSSSSSSSLSSIGGGAESGSGSSRYKIGYDSMAFCSSLSSGVTNMDDLMVHSTTNMSLINGQDDSEEFLSNYSFSSTCSRSQPLSSTSSLLATVKESNDEDDDMLSPENVDAQEYAALPSKAPGNSNRRGSQSSLPTLMETGEEDEEEEDEEEENEDDHQDYDESSEDDDFGEEEEEKSEFGQDAPRTMMEILLERQNSRSPEDDIKDLPAADAEETFETMSEKCLRQAVQSRFTAAQTHLHLEELILKYNPRPEQTLTCLSRALVRWWETKRVATGGPVNIGGIFGTVPVLLKETGEQVIPKVAVETGFLNFFAPLFLHYVATHAEQKTLLDILGEEVTRQGQREAKLLRNHNGQLMALYKFDVVEAEAIVEWWQGLELPTSVFGTGDNLRSL
ncbi:hypothetical protein BG004_000379, partial [Podila humilis]